MKTPRVRVAKKVEVRVDPKLEKLWNELLAKVHAHEKSEADAWDVEWETVGRIVDHAPPLYAFGGYKDAAEFLSKELGVKERVGRAYVRVAERATPQDEIDFGIWKLEAIIGWLEAVHAAVPKGVPVNFHKLKIDGAAAKDCSIPFIKAATRRALTGKNAKNAKTAYRDALERTFSKHKEFASLAIREASGACSFHHVPNAALRTFAELVLEAPLPR